MTLLGGYTGIGGNDTVQLGGPTRIDARPAQLPRLSEVPNVELVRSIWELRARVYALEQEMRRRTMPWWRQLWMRWFARPARRFRAFWS